jgi:hypothetical protein
MVQWEMDDIGGLAEIADDLGVSRQSVSNWAAGRSRTSREFPQPIKRLRATPLYSLNAVRKWDRVSQIMG